MIKDIHVHIKFLFTFEAPVKREKKKYLDDETVQIPDRTLSRWKKRGKEKAKLSLNTLYECDLQTDGEVNTCTLTGPNSENECGGSIEDETPDQSLAINGYYKG